MLTNWEWMIIFHFLGKSGHFRLASVHNIKSTKKSWHGRNPPSLMVPITLISWRRAQRVPVRRMEERRKKMRARKGRSKSFARLRVKYLSRQKSKQKNWESAEHNAKRPPRKIRQNDLSPYCHLASYRRNFGWRKLCVFVPNLSVSVPLNNRFSFLE